MPHLIWNPPSDEVILHCPLAGDARVYLFFNTLAVLAVCRSVAQSAPLDGCRLLFVRQRPDAVGAAFMVAYAVPFGALWLVFLLYVVFTGAIIGFCHHTLKLIFKQPARYTRVLRIVSPLILISFFAVSVYNAYTPVVRHAKITIGKPLAKPVSIGMAADLHLGILVGGRQLDKLADIMNREKVDMILLPGDIMDDNTDVYDSENMKPHFARLRAPMGVFATLGNHDMFSRDPIIHAIQDAGITVLSDQAALVDNQIWVVGRPDQLIGQRMETADLLRAAQVDTSQPVFLLDHRPDDVLAHTKLPIDVQVSGHVHNGQIFPANLLVRFLNRLHYGYEKIANGHFFVTSGYGFWGVPFRLGSQSEVWIIDVEGTPAR